MQNNESSNICTIIVDKYKYLNYNMGVNKRWQQNSSSAINVAEIKTISCPNLIILLKNIFVNYSLQKFYERGVEGLEDKRLQIKEMLFRNTLTQSWLINRLQEHGVKTDKTELSAILNGRRKGNKVTLVLDTSLSILREYEEKMGVKGGRRCDR